ncbi:DUF4296 domain-containing protein [Candidatus Sulfidibacterium hydrothermale]|uniref:DUF4296 domain-containing protein n=1 Tax=Candidatus Sulfidibacterium hydrothermale TaxID=2875962 RepID=UPI001F0AE4FC|nr:DUF4296 domain-containing protein [Candidatus Sulfidibacterium hydrothermale]UBM62751.1 DUF4296 domain-containing protein [Candidatus Sulfidibacterium hydrothermale]
MFKKPVIFLLITLLLTGCYKVNKDVVPKPANLIPKEKMADILTDMEIIEGAKVYNRGRYPGYPDRIKEYYQILFDRYGVTKDQIKASLNYYNNRGDEMASIYDRVLKNLHEKQALLNLEQEIRRNQQQVFPYLFKENGLMDFCYNPII